MARRKRGADEMAVGSSSNTANNKRKQPRRQQAKAEEHILSNDDGHLQVQDSQVDVLSIETTENNEDHDLERRGLGPSKSKFKVVEHEGDIFDAPDYAILIHACNCVGSWGGGIAIAFKERYPEAFSLYKEHCKESTPAKLIGTALLIPPSEEEGPKHWVGCLFTSKKFGRARDSPQQILENTRSAMEELIDQIALAVRRSDTVSEVRICHINSGLFRVPWEQSKAIIEDTKGSDDINVHEISAWVPAKDSENLLNT